MSESKQKAIIIGAGPAGLTAAYEFLNRRTDIKPIVLEKSEYIGGISRTVNYKGNRIDIGGHRFFSKSDKVMNWWFKIMPIEATAEDKTQISYQNKQTQIETQNQVDPDSTDDVMLIRNRKSRIYFNHKFFDYPISLSVQTAINLGPVAIFQSGFSYIKYQILPIKPEKNLEDFYINRFGKKLYELFFKDYTKKVWGVDCSEIDKEWGMQRVKGLSISKVLQDAVKKIFTSSKKTDINQKDTETSLIERFLYPKLGPGQMWQIVAKKVQEMQGEIYMQQDVIKIFVDEAGKKITKLETKDSETGEIKTWEGEYFFSTMPVKELVSKLQIQIPAKVQEVAQNLQYRDFITVGLLVKDLKIKQDTEQGQSLVKDNWIYIQEPDVQIGRLQIFNNWSPFMVQNQGQVWLGLEYFCQEGDELWNLPKEEMIELGKKELEKIEILDANQVIDATVIKMEKTYPAYFGSYKEFHVVKEYLNQFENLFLVGRNGMHKYNNQDHSMLTAMAAVDNIQNGVVDKSNIWAVNTEQEYHENKSNS